MSPLPHRCASAPEVSSIAGRVRPEAGTRAEWLERCGHKMAQNAADNGRTNTRHPPGPPIRSSVDELLMPDLEAQ